MNSNSIPDNITWLHGNRYTKDLKAGTWLHGNRYTKDLKAGTLLNKDLPQRVVSAVNSLRRGK